MFGIGRGVTTLLVGWLWADILLGLFVIFLAASAAPAQDLALAQPNADRAIDPKPLELTLAIDGEALLTGGAATIALEETRIADEVSRNIAADRKVAIVLAFASHDDPVRGDQLARLATAGFRGSSFTDVVVKPMHSIVANDRGSTLSLEIYLYR